MERICTACLSVDRKLYTLKDLKFFYDLLIPDNEYNLPEVQICWECRNTLRKCMQFQRMALTAKDFLNSQSLDPKFYNKQDLLTKSHSNLTTALKTDFDYKYTYKEPSIDEYCDIKQESIASICCKNQKPDVNLCCTKLEPDIETYDEPLNPVKLEVSLETPFPSPIILDDVVSLPSPSVPNLVSKTPQKVFIEPVYQKIGAPKIKTIIAVPNNQMPKQRQKPQSSRAVVNKLAKLSPELVVKFKGESQRIFLNTQRALKEHKTAVKSRKSSTGTPKEKSANIPKNIKQAEELTTEAAKSDEEMELPRTKFPESDEEMELPRTKSPESDEEMELPTTAEIYQSFLATLTEEYKKNFKVIVMSKKEMLSYRKKMSEKSQYVCSTYKCTDCIVGFNSEQELGDHRTAIHTESEDGSTRECLTCHAYVPSNRFAFHYGRHRVLYQCVWCEHSFADVAEVLTHDHDMQFKWGVCGSKLSSKQRQKFRKVYHIDQISTCDICGERFTTKAFLKRHVNRHYAGNEESTKCKICNTDYKDKYTFAAHIKKCIRGRRVAAARAGLAPSRRDPPTRVMVTRITANRRT